MERAAIIFDSRFLSADRLMYLRAEFDAATRRHGHYHALPTYRGHSILSPRLSFGIFAFDDTL